MDKIKLTLSSIVFFILCTTVCAAPIINGATTSSVSGTGFGANTTIGTADLQWTNTWIESGTAGNSMNGAATNWSDYYPMADNEAANSVYSTTRSHSGNQSILNDFYYEQGDSDCNVLEETCRYKGFFRWNSGKTLASTYVSLWVYVDDPEQCTAPGSGCQWKIWRLNNTGLNTDNHPDFMQNSWTGGMREVIMHVDAGHSNAIPSPDDYIDADEVPGPDAVEDKWVRMEYWIEESSEGVSDGTIQYWFHNPSVALKTVTNLVGNQMTRFVTGHFQYAVFGHVSGVPNLKVWWDDIVIQVGTRARVEIGDASTWATCTYRELQKPTSWGTTSVSFDLQQGKLPDGTAYVYIVDDNGDYNSSGYAITLGSAATTVSTGSLPLLN